MLLAHCAQCPPVSLEGEGVQTLLDMDGLCTSVSPALSELCDLCLPLPLWAFPPVTGTDTLCGACLSC